MALVASDDLYPWLIFHISGSTLGFRPNGSLEIGELGDFIYSYNPLESTFNARTIQGFSVEAKEKMYECEKCPYSTYNKYFEYYGVHDYANQVSRGKKDI